MYDYLLTYTLASVISLWHCTHDDYILNVCTCLKIKKRVKISCCCCCCIIKYEKKKKKKKKIIRYVYIRQITFMGILQPPSYICSALKLFMSVCDSVDVFYTFPDFPYLRWKRSLRFTGSRKFQSDGQFVGSNEACSRALQN